MQFFMLCKRVFSRKEFHINAAFMSLFFMYTTNMSSKYAFFYVLSQISHLETMSGY